jgi:hypothetical protein
VTKTLFTGVTIILFLVSFSFSSTAFSQVHSSSETIDHDAEIGHLIEMVIGVAHWLTGIGTIVLAIALIRTFKHMEAVTKMTSIETEYRLRPWIAPVGPIKIMEKSINDDHQFDITIKNFGELAASSVTAKFIKNTEPITRELLQSNSADSYNLGPVMPTMEKHYWFFINSETWNKSDGGLEPLHIGLYFEYSTAGKKSGYGMLSEYNSTTKNFVHKDMWIDN